MHIKFTDITNQAVWANRQMLTVLLPSPVLAGGGDGQCRVFAGGTMSIVTRAEAERLVVELTKEDQTHG